MANAEQREFLSRFGVETVHGLSDPLDRLRYTEIDSTPDPEPVETGSEYTDVQLQYLGGRTIYDLDDLERDILARFVNPNGSAKRSVSKDSHPGDNTDRSAGPPKLDVKKIAKANLHPNRRAELAEHFSVIEKAHREAAAGIDPRLRETRYDLDAALRHAGPYLI